LFKSAISEELYYQFYNSSGVGNGWRLLNDKAFVRNSGAALINTDGRNLTGTVTNGSITNTIVASGTGFPTTNGQSMTMNGSTGDRTYSIFRSLTNDLLYYQAYNSSSVGKGWKKILTGDSIAVTNGAIPIGKTSTGDFAIATITAGPAISVTNASGSITVGSAIFEAAGTATLDFPSTAFGSSSDLTFGVAGAEVGDPVVIGIPIEAITTTGKYQAWVSAKDTVKIRFIPNATEDPASGTFSVTIFKKTLIP